MEKVYVIYEKYSEDFMKLNNYNEDVEIKGIFKSIYSAKGYVENEINFQCENNEDWHYGILSNENKVVYNIYFKKELQYSIICEEVKLV